MSTQCYYYTSTSYVTQHNYVNNVMLFSLLRILVQETGYSDCAERTHIFHRFVFQSDEHIFVFAPLCVESHSIEAVGLLNEIAKVFESVLFNRPAIHYFKR